MFINYLITRHESEVSQFNIQLCIKHNIHWLKVTMTNVLAVHVAQNIAHLLHEESAALLVEVFGKLLDIIEAAACDVLHQNK